MRILIFADCCYSFENLVVQVGANLRSSTRLAIVVGFWVNWGPLKNQNMMPDCGQRLLLYLASPAGGFEAGATMDEYEDGGVESTGTDPCSVDAEATLGNDHSRFVG